MHDTESGLVYNRNRYLNSSLGLFISRDSIGYFAGFQLYQYLGSSPINLLDSMGNKPRLGPDSSPTSKPAIPDSLPDLPMPKVPKPPAPEYVKDPKQPEGTPVDLKIKERKGEYCGEIRLTAFDKNTFDFTFKWKESWPFACGIQKKLFDDNGGNQLETTIQNSIDDQVKEEKKQGQNLRKVIRCEDNKVCCNKKIYNGKYPVKLSFDIDLFGGCRISGTLKIDATFEGEIGECK